MRDISRKLINHKYIDKFQMGWYTSKNSIRFRVDDDKKIETLLEHQNLNNILENFQVDLIKDKIQS